MSRLGEGGGEGGGDHVSFEALTVLDIGKDLSISSAVPKLIYNASYT